MTIQLFMSVGAIVCTAAVVKYIWQEKGCFKVVYDDIKRELKQNTNNGKNY